MNISYILCVCTGNICRSPLAEGLLRVRLPDVTVTSAGIGAVEGGRMPEHAQAIADRDSLPLMGHRGRQITAPMVKAADIILVMEKGQLEWLTSRYPETRGRVFMASHWTTQQDVDDPYRESDQVFERVYIELKAGVDAWAAKLGGVTA